MAVRYRLLIITLVTMFVLVSCAGAFDMNLAGGYPAECKLTPQGREYAGTLNRTVSGFDCQLWTSNDPHSHYFTEEHDNFPEKSAAAATNFCRNPDLNWGEGVWCYTTDPTKRWEACDVELCECKVTTSGDHYEGQINVTRSGLGCQIWTAQSPHPHPYTSAELFPDQLLRDAGNFCRNPNASRPEGPWCYTTSRETEWEYCSVPDCDMQMVTFSPMTTTTALTSSTTTTTPTTQLATRPATATRPTTATGPTTATRPTATTRPTTTTRPTIATPQTINAGSTTSGTSTTQSGTPSKSDGSPTTSAHLTATNNSDGDTVGQKGGSSKTVVAASVSVSVVVLLAIGGAVVFILYRRGLFKRFLNTEAHQGFENPSFE